MEYKFESILIIRLSSIGDVILTTPLVRGLRHRFPDASISYAVESKSIDAIRGNPNIDEVILFPKLRWEGLLKDDWRNWRTVIREAGEFVRSLRRRKFDLALDLHNVTRSSLLSFLSGANIRVGNRDQTLNVLSTRRIPQRSCHIVDRYFDLVGWLGVSSESAGRKPDFHFSREDMDSALRLLRESSVDGRRFAVINAGTTWRSKYWGDDRFAAVGDHIRENHGLSVLISGGATREERERVERVCNSMRRDAVDISGRLTLKGLGALLGLSDIMVTGDSGPMHIASALGTPTVALFGPTDPRIWGPVGGNNVILRVSSCTPCHKKVCDSMDCMRGIGVDGVKRAVDKVLEGNR
ncbi:MAG: glycosyltransferase family 9 protein [bacterium]